MVYNLSSFKWVRIPLGVQRQQASKCERPVSEGHHSSIKMYKITNILCSASGSQNSNKV